MAKLPAKKKPKNMIEGKTGEAAKVQKPIRIPTVKKDAPSKPAPSKPAPQIVTKPSPSIAKAGSRTVIPKGMTQGKLDPKRVIKEPRTKDDTATAATPKGKKLSGFGTAFAAARKAGKKEFTYRGKRYNTKVK